MSISQDMADGVSSDRDVEPPPNISKNSTSPSSPKKTRVVYGIAMALMMFFIIYLGHFWICIFIFFIQCGLFHELLCVRYADAVEKQIPYFRTIHWSMFLTSLFLSSMDSLAEWYSATHPVIKIPFRYAPLIGAIAYTSTFVQIVLSLRKGFLKYQLSQVAWTGLTIVLVVYQTRLYIPVVYSGLIWFFIPAACVILNDTCAYFVGIKCGKKYFPMQLTPLSPNKSWEGFIGGLIGSVVLSQILLFFTKNPWLYCPASNVTCELPHFYQFSEYKLPAFLSTVLFTKTIHLEPIRIHTFVFAAFASLCAPFGGFLASAIKRAYGKKDFNSLIPGHGGFMDRFDCQILMIYYTCIHYNTFIKDRTPDMNKIVKLISLLSLEGKMKMRDVLSQVIQTEQSINSSLF